MECLRAGEGKAVIRIWMEPQERGRGEGERRGERRKADYGWITHHTMDSKGGLSPPVRRRGHHGCYSPTHTHTHTHTHTLRAATCEHVLDEVAATSHGTLWAESQQVWASIQSHTGNKKKQKQQKTKLLGRSDGSEKNKNKKPPTSSQEIRSCKDSLCVRDNQNKSTTHQWHIDRRRRWRLERSCDLKGGSN